MTNLSIQNKLTFIGIAIIYLFAWHLQNIFLLNSDVSWLIHAAQQLLHGGTYSNNFYETNPPLILYLYIPIIYLVKLTHLSLSYALRMYIDILVGLSLFFCRAFLISLQSISSLFLITLSIILLILPLSDFGQREHLTLIFIMPYLLLITARLDNKPIHYPIIIGIMAGIGFCLKPFFLLSYGLIIIYFYVKKKNIPALFNQENIALWTTALLYLGIIFVFHQDYLHIILPLISPFYYSIYTVKISILLHLPFSLFFYTTILLFLIRCSHQEQNTLENILFLSSLGFWLAFLIQRTNWFYHELPSLGLSILLVTLLFNSFLSKISLVKNDYIKIILLSTMIGSYLYYDESYIFVNLPFPFYLTAYFCLFAFVFCLVLFNAYPFRYLKALLYTTIIIGSGILLYHYLLFTIWLHETFILTTIIIYLLFSYAIPHERLNIIGKWLLLSLLGITIYIYPFYRAAFVTVYSNYYFSLYQQLIAATQIYQHQSSYYFTNTSEIPFPLIDYTHQHYVSRFWSFVWLPIMPQPKKFDLYSQFYQHHQKAFEFYISTIITDFKKNKPDIVFVDDSVHSNKKYYGSISPDYLALFNQNLAFSDIWKNYQFSQLIDLPPLCRLKVYIRK